MNVNNYMVNIMKINENDNLEIIDLKNEIENLKEENYSLEEQLKLKISQLDRALTELKELR